MSAATESLVLKPRGDSDKAYHTWLWIALAAGVIWRVVRYALDFPFHGDEAMLALNLLDRGILGLARPLDHDQMAPPLFLMVSQLLRLAISSSEMVLRLMPLAAGLAALGAFAAFTRRWVEPLAAAVAVALMAVSYSPNLHATDFKPYALDLLFGVLYLQLGWRLLRAPDRVGNYAALAVLGPLAAGFSYPSVLVFAGVSAVILPDVLRRSTWNCRCVYLLANLLTGVALLLVLRISAAPEARHTSQFMQEFWADGFPVWNLPGFFRWLYISHTRAVLGYPYKSREFFGVLMWIMALVGFVHLLRTRRARMAALLLLPFVFSILAACLRRYPYGGDARLQQHLAPGAFILAGLGVSGCVQAAARGASGRAGATWRWVQRTCRGLPHALVAALLLIVPVGIVHDVRFPYIRSLNDVEARRTAAELPAKIGAGTTVYLPDPSRDYPSVFLAYLEMNAPFRAGLPPVTGEAAPKQFCVFIADEVGDGPDFGSGWARTTVLDREFLKPVGRIAAAEHRCRIYLFQFRKDAEHSP